jgi:hypothetical protein
MPIYEFRGIETGRIYEWVGRYEEKPRMLYDPETEEEFRPIVSRPSLLKSNLSDWQRGLSGAGQHDKALNQVVYGERHRDEILQRRGLVREQDLPKHWVEDAKDQQMKQNEQLDKDADKFFDNMKKFGLDKQGSDTVDRVKRTEQFWSEQVPSGAVRQDPTKYGVKPKEK